MAKRPGRSTVIVTACVAVMASVSPASVAVAAREGPPRPEAPLRFDHLTVAEGLPTNWVMAVLQDSRGFSWFGTHQGLVRFDGTNLAIHRSDPQDPKTLPSSHIGMLYEDRRQRLFVGFAWARQGLALYDRACECFERIGPGDGARDVRAMLEDRAGRMWIGSEDGVSRLDVARRSWTSHPIRVPGRTVAQPVVNALIEDRAGRLWVGTDSGLFRFDPGTGAYEPWPGAPDDPTSLAGAPVWDLLEGTDGTLFVATIGAGLHRVTADTGKGRRYVPVPGDPSSLSHLRVRRLAADREGRLLYVGTENGGLNVLDLATDRFTRYAPDAADPGSLGSSSVWAVRLDAEGTVWVGTYGGGVQWASAAKRRFRLRDAGRDGLSDPHVSSVVEDRSGRLWIGTDGGGLNRLDPSGRHRVYRHTDDPWTLGSDAVQALLEDRHGTLWVGGWDSGLNRLDPVSGRVTRLRHRPGDASSLPSDHVWTVRELRGGELVVGTQAGAAFFDRDSGRFRTLSDLHPTLGAGVVHAVAEDGRGGLWLCGYNFPDDATVARVDRTTGEVRHYRSDPRDPTSLAAGWCLSAAADAADNVWIGTQGALNVLTSGASRFRRRSPALSSDEVTNLIEDGGDLWMTAGPRLFRLRDAVSRPAGSPADVFDGHDGFHGPAPLGSAFRSAAGEIFVGGVRGLTTFSPRKIRPNETPPRVVLTGVKVLNRSLKPCVDGSSLARSLGETDRLTLSYRDSVVTFEFAALNFSLPAKNQYSYRLEGFDRDWSDAGALTQATYTNLSPGAYTFRVRAANNDGVWNEEGAALRLVVTPPFWGTWWFRSLAAMATLGWAVQLHRWRVMRLTAQARALAAKMDERTRIARELHDTLEQALAGIRLQLGVAARSIRRAPEQAETNVALARRMLSHCIGEARRAVMDLRSQPLEDSDLPTALAEQGRRLTAATPVAVEVTVLGAHRRLEAEAEHHLFRIGQEAITNALKHSGGDRVRVDLCYEADGVRLVVEDNGRGLPAHLGSEERHFGLQGMRERAERLGGTLSVAPAPFGGVRIAVEVAGPPAAGRVRRAGGTRS